MKSHKAVTFHLSGEWEAPAERTEMKICNGVDFGNVIMGGATGGCGGGQCPPPTFGTSGVQGGTEGRSNENDFCFYNRQSLFSN